MKPFVRLALPPGVVTATSTAPAACAGAVAVIEVALSTVKLVAAVPPKLTTVAPVKPVPVIVTDVPPAAGPPFGVTEAIVGRRRQVGESVRQAGALVRPGHRDGDRPCRMRRRRWR